MIWAVGGLLLALLGRWLGKSDLTYQANAAALAAVMRVWLVNYEAGEIYYSGLTLRLISVTAVAVTFVRGLSLELGQTSRMQLQTTFGSGTLHMGWNYPACALAWYEVRVPALAVVWAFGGLVLALIGRSTGNRDLTYQANLLALAAFVETVVFNYSATIGISTVSQSALSVCL